MVVVTVVKGNTMLNTLWLCSLVLYVSAIYWTCKKHHFENSSECTVGENVNTGEIFLILLISAIYSNL